MIDSDIEPESNGPWREIAWWIKQVINNRNLGLTDGEGCTVIRIYSSSRSEHKEPTIIASIIFRENYIELYHTRAIDTIKIDIQDHGFLEKIVEWLYDWNFQLDEQKLKEMQCTVEPPSHHGLF